jgi:hypothetical protein
MLSRPGCDALEGRQLLSMFGATRGGALPGSPQAQVGRVHSFSALAAGRQNGLGGTSGSGQGRMMGMGLHGRGRHSMTTAQAHTNVVGATSPSSVSGAASTAILAPVMPLSSPSPAGQMSPIGQGGGTPTSTQSVNNVPGSPSPTSQGPGGGMQGAPSFPGQGQNQPGGFGGAGQGGPAGFLGRQGGGFSGTWQGNTGFGQGPGGPGGQSTQVSTGTLQASGGWGQSGTAQGTGTSTTTNIAALQKDFQKLNTDMQAIQDKSQVTPALLAAVRTDVQGLQKESTSAPTRATLTTLGNDLSALGGATPDFTQGALKADLEAALKSAGVSDAALESTLETDLNAVAAAMDVTSSDVATIQADLKAIASDSGSSTSNTPTNPLADVEDRLLLGEFTGSTEALPFAGPGTGLSGGPVALRAFDRTGQATNQPGPEALEILMAGRAGGANGGTQGMPFPGYPSRGPWGI